MAYDEELAQRVRDLLVGKPGLAEMKMFGGLAFLVGGNMAVATSGQGGLLVRVDPEATETLLANSHADPMMMRGRPLVGWLRVDARHVQTDAELADWVERGIAYASSLPAKHEPAVGARPRRRRTRDSDDQRSQGP